MDRAPDIRRLQELSKEQDELRDNGLFTFDAFQRIRAAARAAVGDAPELMEIFYNEVPRAWLRGQPA